MEKSFVYNSGSSDDDIEGDEIRLEFGVFIDGTLNNKDNTDLRVKYKGKSEKGLTPEEKQERKQYLAASNRNAVDKMGTDNSFSNDYTNVARKWTCCKSEYRIYVAGMGTSDVEKQGIKKDDGDGFQYGAGNISGIRARVRLGCERLAEKIALEISKGGKQKATTVTVDVFGFSRGAAAARNFVYEITKSEYAPAEIEVSYYEDKVVPESHTFTKTERLVIIPKHTIKVKKKKKVLLADSDGLKTDSSLYTNGKLPKMGHLGYSLLKSGVSKKNLEKIKIAVQFLGIYDTVSSYEEWGALGGDSTAIKGLKHLRDSLFKDDIAQLNLNTLSCVKIVHFTAKDEHRENFDLTRIPNANVKNNLGNFSRIEKNFPGVHCDIGGAYLTDKEIVDEIEVVGKPDFTGLKSIEELKKFSKKLVSEYWYTPGELKISTQSLPQSINPVSRIVRKALSYQKLAGTREKIYKEYSYIPLHFMNEYCDKDYMSKNIIENKIALDYPIKNSNLKDAYTHLEKYVMNKGGKEWNFISDDVFIRKQKLDAYNAEKKEKEKQDGLKNSKIFYDRPKIAIDNTRVVRPKFEPALIPLLTDDQKLLRMLRNKFFHWSASRDWAGMDPTTNRKRVEH